MYTAPAEPYVCCELITCTRPLRSLFSTTYASYCKTHYIRLMRVYSTCGQIARQPMTVAAPVHKYYVSVVVDVSCYRACAHTCLYTG